MRAAVLFSLAAILLGVVGYSYWKGASEKAAAEREAQWSQPYNSAYAAYEQKRYADSEAMVTALLSKKPDANPTQMTNALMLLGVVDLCGIATPRRNLLKKSDRLRRQDPKTQAIDLAISLSRLSEALRNQGKYTEAAQISVEASASSKESEGYGKPLAVCLLNLGIIADEERKWDEADGYLTQSAAASEKYLGRDNPDTAVALFRLAELRLEQADTPKRRLATERLCQYRKRFRLRKRGCGRNT